MATVEEARQSVTQARSVVEQQRQQAERAAQQLREQQKRIPQTSSQQALRQKYSGLQGLRQRKVIESARKGILQNLQGVSDYKKELSRYEQEEITPTENAIRDYEQAQALQQQRNEQYSYAVKAYLGLTSGGNISSVPEDIRVLAQQKAEEIERQNLRDFENQIQSSLPEGATYTIDFPNIKNLRATVSSKLISESPKKDLQKALPSLSREDKAVLKEIKPLNFATGFSIVSAQPTEEILYTPVQKETQPSVIKQSTIEVAPTDKEAREAQFQREIEKKGLFGGVFSVLSSDIKDITGLRDATPAKNIWESLAYKNIGESLAYVDTLGGTISPETKRLLAKSEQSDIAASILFPTPKIIAPSKIAVPKRALRDIEALEIRQPVSLFGKETTLSSYRISREISPPSSVLKYERGGGLLGYDDVLKIKPARVETVVTPFKILGDESFITASRTGAGRTVRLSEVSGSSVPRTLSELKKLPEREQFLWQRVAEDIAGRPVSLKNVPKVISKEAQLSRGYVNEYSFSRPVGRKTTKYETASVLKKSGGNELYDVFKGRTLYKDITKPLARSAGKTPKIKETVIVIKEPLIIGEDTSVTSFIGGGKKSSDIFLKQLYQTERPLQLTPKPLPKAIRTPRTKLINTQSTSRDYGKLGLLSGIRDRVDGSSFVRDSNSDFSSGRYKALYGTETPFERTSAQADITGFTTYKPETNIRANTQLGTSQVESSRVSERFQEPKTSLKSFESQKEISSERLSIVPRERLAEKQLVSQKLRQEEKQTQRTQQTQKQTRPRSPQVNKPKPPIPLTPYKDALKTFVKSKDLGTEFEVFGKRFGKLRKLEEVGTRQEAAVKLRAFLKGSLGRSGKVRQGGRFLTFRELGLGSEFRPAKKDITTIVQKAKYSLGTQLERKEIQFFRKKGKNKGWL